MTKIAVIFSGCGHQDGSEIRESVFTMLAIDKLGAEYQIFAPDIQQNDVVNHLNGNAMDENRNVLIEAARIARGDIKNLAELNVDNFEALILPGGFGAAKNLSDLAFKGAEATILPQFQTIIDNFLQARKPIGAICIAPAILAAAINKNIKVTIGDDADGLIKSLGAEHQKCKTEQCVIDTENKIVTTSAYMRDDARIYDVYLGIERLVQAVVNLS